MDSVTLTVGDVLMINETTENRATRPVVFEITSIEYNGDDVFIRAANTHGSSQINIWRVAEE